jgi:hypothetical protein
LRRAVFSRLCFDELNNLSKPLIPGLNICIVPNAHPSVVFWLLVHFKAVQRFFHHGATEFTKFKAVFSVSFVSPW